MAKLKPFCGIRYNPEKINIEKVVAPPYDVISRTQQDALYDKNEYNVIRLILGKDHLKDSEKDNKYIRARKFINDWIKSGVLIQDEKASLYLYSQSYTHPRLNKKIERISFFSLIKLEDFSKGIVFPHERTHSLPKVDRMHLLKEVKANLSPVFGLYDDKKGKIRKIFDSYLEKPPVYSFTDADGVTHKLWTVSEPKDIEFITENFKDKAIIIADGHHRYETALEYRNTQRSQKPTTEETSFDYTMISLVEFHDPGLLIYPTHRLVKRTPQFNKEEVLKRVEKYFSVKPTERSKLHGLLNSIGRDKKVFGLYLGKDEVYILELKDGKTVKEIMPTDKPEEWRELDVSILSYLVLEKCLGLKDKVLEEVIDYTRSEEEALECVDSGNFSLAFLLRPTIIDEIKKVTEKKEVMPQKSTYFYPKLVSGLVFHKHEPKP